MRQKADLFPKSNKQTKNVVNLIYHLASYECVPQAELNSFCSCFYKTHTVIKMIMEQCGGDHEPHGDSGEKKSSLITPLV